MIETPKEAARRLSAPVLRKGFQPVALHTYTDTEGEPRYWRIRAKHPNTGEKWIRPMKLNGQGYELGEPQFEDGKPLYALHHIASNPDADLWIVEGEQKADALNQLGLVATTTGSATSADNADWKPLRGRNVIIWPDNDDPGEVYAGEVASILRGLDCKVSCLDVDKLGLGKAEDVIDWLAAHPGAARSDLEGLPMLPAIPDQSNALAGDSDGWPEPQPLSSKIEPEPYPIDALPDTIRAAVEEVVGFVKAPVPLVASSALAALSLACQAHIDAKRLEKLHGPVGLFILVIADSGERKSTCDGFFIKTIIDYVEAQEEAAKTAQKDHRAATEAWEAKRQGIKEKIRQLAKGQKSTADMESALRDLEHDKPKPPRIPHLLYGDVTPEELARCLAREWPSGGVISAEAGIVFGSHGMGKDSVMRNLALLNTLWDGKRLSVDRKTTESFTVRGARLTVALQVQELTLREFFARSGALARGTGFLARFLVAWPESTQGMRLIDPNAPDGPATWPHLAEFNRRIAVVLEQPVPIDDDGSLTPSLMALTPEAKTAWVEFHNAIESELASGGELYEVRDVASKSADNAARLAALFQQVEHGMGGAIGLDSFERAGRITAWHLSESRRFFGELALPPELVDAARLDSWLLNYCQQARTLCVAKNHVRQHGPLRDGARLDTAISELAELDRLRLLNDGKRRMIHPNPALLGVVP